MTAIDAPPSEIHDQRVFLHHVTWQQYEQLLEMRGESSVPRIAYLEGLVELMSPSQDHEYIKKTLARLIEVWALERDVALTGVGSMTLKNRLRKRGVEADECYVVGRRCKRGGKERPDLAIEVEWTSGGIDKLEIYRRLGVREVWRWRDERVLVYVLQGSVYVESPRSVVLPDLDLGRLVEFLGRDDQLEAVRAYRDWLRSQ
jgi:Uma2 family endonuclease